jgi:glucosamine--fructose-6-phosphate aminotransferase (isomerizing)
MTDRITYLEEGDRAVVTRQGVTIHDANGTVVTRAIRQIQIDATRVDKAGHKHFMAKEIAEQPEVLGNTLANYLGTGTEITLPGAGSQPLGGTLPGAGPQPGADIDFTAFDRITMVACGTAYYACMTAKYWFEQIARIPVEIDVASEFRYREPPIPARTLAIFVSQSGETADTLAALRYCVGKADKIVSVVNVPESSIARESDLALPIYAGIEVGVASTKAFTCQLTVLLMLALKAAQVRGEITADTVADHLASLRSVPALMKAGLEQSGAMQRTARKLSEARDILFMGRGMMYPLAMEGALKLKEISYIHAEAYASGELKHGPIALIDKHVPVVVMAPRDALFDKTVSNMQEVMARKGKVVLISDARGLAEAGEGVWEQIEMPKCPDIVAPIVYAVPAQLLAYHTAVAKGTDVDQPRNLAKSVTVE